MWIYNLHMGNQNSHIYYVYIMPNNAGITYVGVTNDLERRVAEHKIGKFSGFSKVHGTHKLVFYEEFEYIYDAIAREKQIKSWRKVKKRKLIVEFNPKWTDLSAGWDEGTPNLVIPSESA